MRRESHAREFASSYTAGGDEKKIVVSPNVYTLLPSMKQEGGWYVG